MTAESGHTPPEPPPKTKNASLLHTMWIVVSGLFMVGRNRDFGPAAPKIDPALLVIVALVGAVLVIASLVMLAKFIAH
jgi:hypothetical protein